MRRILVSLLCLVALAIVLPAQSHQDGAEHSANQEETHSEGGHECACHEDEAYDPGASAFHHISDANVFHIAGEIYLPLPCILYAPGHGLSVFLSNKFHFHEHGNGAYAVDGYVLNHGEVMRVAQAGFPMEGEVAIECFTETHTEDGKTINQVIYEGQCYNLDKKTSYDGGIMGGGVTSYYDFSITKNVLTMLMTFVLLFFLLRAAAKGYQSNDGKAPKGVQAFIEPVFLFIRDEVAVPFLGAKYERYLPYLMSIFFFILGLNLVGQLPIFPGSGNVTGNLSVTAVLAVIAFVVVNLSGNKNYWQHIFNMPGVPGWIKIILTPVELLGIFIKPLTLMLRLFANITAGHIVIIIFVSLIFIFGKAGESIGGSALGGVMAVPLTMFMMSIELLVAFIQAFVFCILTASYIGAAVEEHHEHH